MDFYEKQRRVGVEKQFDSYCKTCVRNFFIDFFRAGKRRERIIKRAIKNAEQISDENEIYARRYKVFDKIPVTISRDFLCEALDSIEPRNREIVLAYYMVGFRDGEIGQLVHISRRRVNEIRLETLEQLREFLEALI